MGHIGKKIGHALGKVVKTVTKPVGAVVGAITGTGGSSAKTVKIEQPTAQVSAPAVAAPEPVVGQEDTDLTGRKIRRNNKGKSSLFVGGYTGSGGTTGTGLNL